MDQQKTAWGFLEMNKLMEKEMTEKINAEQFRENDNKVAD